MKEKGYDPMTEQAEDRNCLPIEEIEEKIDQIIEMMQGHAAAEGADDGLTDKDIKQMMKTADQLPEGLSLPDIMMEVIRPFFREMEPERRRRFCADMEMCRSPSDKKRTGRYFNGFKSARGRAEPDYRELGRRIMEKRNPHYHPDHP